MYLGSVTIHTAHKLCVCSPCGNTSQEANSILAMQTFTLPDVLSSPSST